MCSLYSNLILPYLQYCIMSKCLCYPFNQINNAIKRVIRLTSSVGYRDHISELFQKHKLLQICVINKLQIANFVFNYHNHALPNILRSYFSVNNHIHHLINCIKSDLSLIYVFILLEFKDSYMEIFRTRNYIKKKSLSSKKASKSFFLKSY